MIKILLVDDQNLLCEVLESRLEIEPDFEIVGRANDGESAIKMVENLQPDMVLLDVEMPKMDGFTAARIIKQNAPQTKIIILSGHKDESFLQKSLEAGAISYLPKDTTADELKNTIRSVYNEQSIINSKMWERFQEKLDFMQSEIDIKWSEIETDFQQVKSEFRKSIETIFNAEARVSQSFQESESRLESRWQGLQKDVVNLKDEISAIMNTLDQVENEYEKYLTNLKRLKLDLEATLNNLNQMGFNQENFKKIDNLQEQINTYKVYTHQIYQEKNNISKFSTFAFITSIFAIFISFGCLFFIFINR